VNVVTSRMHIHSAESRRCVSKKVQNVAVQGSFRYGVYEC